MIYDQGYFIEFNLTSTQVIRFQANFWYSLRKSQVTEEALDDISTGSYSSFNSECTRTMMGLAGL